jgi:hypothetical protein
MTKVLTVQRLMPIALVIALALAFGTYANAQTTGQYTTTPPTTYTTTPPATTEPLTTTPPATTQPLTTTPPATTQPLPPTGGFSAPLLIGALLLLVPGVLIFAVRRRR